MSLLNPIPALILAGLVVPALLLLYFLKLRRKEEWIGSTLLWRSAAEDLQANAPFQRLRASWLLFLQLLLLALLLAALARPIFGRRDASAAPRVIMLIDVSASMGAAPPRSAADGPSRADDPPSRLERAQRTALRMLDRLSRRGEGAQVMVIAFASRARLVQPFTSDLRLARAAIETLEVLEEPGLLGPALRLAETYAGPEESDDSTAPPRTILLSDGRFADDRTPSYGGGVVEFLSAAPGAEERDDSANVGITFLAARRDVLDPQQVDVLCGVASTDTALRSIRVEAFIDDAPLDAQVVALEATSADAPAEGLARFRFTIPSGGVLRCSIAHRDSLAADNAAGLVLAPPSPAAILVVHPDDEPAPDAYLMSVVSELPLYLVESWPAARFEAATSAGAALATAGGEAFRLVIFDRVSASRPPALPSLSFGARPPLTGLSLMPAEAEQPGRRILSWSRQHPVMASVGLDTIAIADRRRISLPEQEGEVLALAEGGPIIALVEPRGGQRHLVVSFDLRQSNWPLHVSFAIFIQNAADYLTSRGAADAGWMIRTGEAVNVRAARGAATVELTGPQSRSIDVRGDGSVTLGPLDRVGVYRATGLPPEHTPVIANLLSETESDLRPVEEVRIGQEAASAQSLDRSTPRELWPWFVAAALALLGVEWVVYLLRARTR